MTSRALVVIAALAMAGPASAETHRWVDARGVVNYSDRAPQRPPEPGMSVAAVVPAEPAGAVTAAPAAPPTAVEPPVPGGPVTLDGLFELTGTRRQLAALTVRLAREFRPAKGQVSAAAEATLERIVARTFDQEVILRGVREEFARGLDRAKLESKLAWLRSPLGHRIAALEMATAEPDHERRMAAWALTLKASPPGERRLELIERLDWVAGASVVSVDVAAALSSSVARAIALHTPPDRRTSRRQIESQAEEMRASAAGPMRKAAALSMLYTYRALGDDELERYVEFESTEAGRWYNALLRRALLASLTRAFDETAQAMFAAVPPESWARTTGGDSPR